jgi:molecular chaperone GrpE
MSDRSDTEVPVKVIDRRWWAQPDGAQAATPEDGRPEKPSYVQELERQIAEKDRQLQEALTKYRESAREFDDSRARLRKDVSREIERGRQAMLVELVEVVDNLDRAIGAGRQATDPAALLGGIDLVRRMFVSKLEGFGLTRIDPLGEPFDPTRHEAITVVPTTEPAQDGLVCGVVAPGYLVGDEVLRPARVAVSQLTA